MDASRQFNPFFSAGRHLQNSTSSPWARRREMKFEFKRMQYGATLDNWAAAQEHERTKDLATHQATLPVSPTVKYQASQVRGKQRHEANESTKKYTHEETMADKKYADSQADRDQQQHTLDAYGPTLIDMINHTTGGQNPSPTGSFMPQHRITGQGRPTP